jgi:hypothetical protein
MANTALEVRLQIARWDDAEWWDANSMQGQLKQRYQHEHHENHMRYLLQSSSEMQNRPLRMEASAYIQHDNHSTNSPWRATRIIAIEESLVQCRRSSSKKKVRQ